MKKYLCLLLVLACVLAVLPAEAAISDKEFFKLCGNGSEDYLKSVMEKN